MTKKSLGCDLTESGLCFVKTSIGWADYYDAEAKMVWQKAQASTDPNEVIELGKQAAGLREQASNLRVRANEIQPCGFCPLRKEAL